MKKSILFFATLFLLSITSCKKANPAPTKPVAPVNPYTEIGLDKIGGKYSGSYLSYQDITNPNALPQKDENYSVDISYVNNSIDVTINTSLNIPASLKQFSIQKSDVMINEMGNYGYYVGSTDTTINGEHGTYYNNTNSDYCWFKKTINIQLVKNSNSVESSITQFYYGNNQGLIILGGNNEIAAAGLNVKRKY